MKCVIDTNIIFSALYRFDSPAGDLLVLAIYDRVTFYAPESVKEKLIRNLRDKLGYSITEIDATIIALPITWVEKETYAPHLPDAVQFINHEPDVPVVACALALGLAIIPGNKHFHPLKKEGIKVWRLKEVLGEIGT